MAVPTDAYSQIGNTGLIQYGGFVVEEYLPELSGQRGRRVYREMADNDPVIAGVLFVIGMLCRGVQWHVNPADDTPEAQAIAHFVEEVRADMSHSWEDFIDEVLTMLVYGFSFFEIVYKLRGGTSDDPTKRSRYDDGRIGWRKFAIRSQDTLLRWELDGEGGVQGFVQWTPGSGLAVTIPIDKALLFRTTTRKGDPEGKSILRTSYRSWHAKTNITRIEGIGIERDLAGLPVVTVPAEWLMPSATDGEKAVVAQMSNLVTRIRRDQQEGVVMPASYDDHGNKTVDIRLLSTGGTRQFDIDKTIVRYDQRIAMTVLADFILLGHDTVGSKALAATRTDLFATAITAWLDSIQSVLNSHAIPRLLRLNGMDTALAPELVHDDIQPRDLAQIADYVQKLVAAGMPLFPDPDLQRYLLESAGLPAPAAAATETAAISSSRTDPAQTESVDVGDDLAGRSASETAIAAHARLVSQHRIHEEVAA